MSIAVSMVTTGLVMLLLNVVAASYFISGPYQWERLDTEVIVSLVFLAGGLVLALIVHIATRRAKAAFGEELRLACKFCGVNLASGCDHCPNCGVGTAQTAEEAAAVIAYQKNRFVRRIPRGVDAGQALRAAEEYLVERGFQCEDAFGERFWRRGSGVLGARVFIKLAFSSQETLLLSWMQWSLLPGLYGGESMKEWSGKNRKTLDGLESVLRTRNDTAVA